MFVQLSNVFSHRCVERHQKYFAGAKHRVDQLVDKERPHDAAVLFAVSQAAAAATAPGEVLFEFVVRASDHVHFRSRAADVR